MASKKRNVSNNGQNVSCESPWPSTSFDDLIDLSTTLNGRRNGASVFCWLLGIQKYSLSLGNKWIMVVREMPKTLHPPVRLMPYGKCVRCVSVYHVHYSCCINIVVIVICIRREEIDKEKAAPVICSSWSGSEGDLDGNKHDGSRIQPRLRLVSVTVDIRMLTRTSMDFMAAPKIFEDWSRHLSLGRSDVKNGDKTAAWDCGGVPDTDKTTIDGYG